MIGHDVEAKVTALIDDRFPQRFFRRRLCLTQESFEFEVTEINGDQDGTHQAERGQDHDRGGNAPCRNSLGGFAVFRAAHGRGSVSRDAAQSSSHISPLSVHSSLSRTEMYSSSSLSVPWPKGQMYSMR